MKLARILVASIGLAVYGVGAVIALFFAGSGERRLPAHRRHHASDFFYRAGGPLGFGIVEVEMLLNVLVFVPIGVFAAMLLPRRLWWVAVLGGAALSAAAEAFQYVVLSSRVGSVRDVVLNIVGTALGALVVFGIRTYIRTT